MKVLNVVEKFGYSKGQAEAISGIIIGAVMLFIGLFMIAAVSDATAIDNTSDFVDTKTGLISTMGTVFSVLGLVLIVIALALAISALKGSMIGGGRPVA